MATRKNARKRSTLSAGILAYRHVARGLEVLLVHPGGPYWHKKDNGAWSIPKGEMDATGDPEQVVRREFAEELGPGASVGPLRSLGDVQQLGVSGVIAFAGEGQFEPAALVSNTFDIEWPPREAASARYLRGLPLTQRKKQLKAILPKSRLISSVVTGPPPEQNSSKKPSARAWEGIMAKRADSKYLSGARSLSWLKIKTSRRQEVVIAGFTAPRRTGPFFGALTLALRDVDNRRYIGHVGTGFSHETLEEVHGKLMRLETAKSPFGKEVKDEASTTWVKPQLVAEVKFTEWTSSGEMRHPVYLGLREDKDAKDVVLEREKRRAH